MNLFSISEAHYYCSHFAATTGDSEGSIDAFRQGRLGNGPLTLREGTTDFQEFQDCSLRDVERSLFLSAGQYRRSLDLMIRSASPWAHVTLYYGSYYAARALLGMFGSVIFKGKFVIDVGKGAAGSQELRFRRIGNSSPAHERSRYGGSHERFWDLFYKAISSLRPFTAVNLAAALSPVSGNPVWQTEKRNEVNYDPVAGLNLAILFGATFTTNAFRSSLPGVLGTQFHIVEALLTLAYDFAGRFGLQTDALDRLGAVGVLRDKVRMLIYDERAPGLGRQTRSIKLVVT